jgi:Trypsin-like peptidase domain
VSEHQELIPGAPVNVGWLVLVATEAVRFFSVQYHSEILDKIGKTDPPGGIQPFSLAQFLSYLQSHGFPNAWPLTHHIRRLVDAMARAGVLGEAGYVHQAATVGMCYYTERVATRSQSRGYMWLSEVVGAQLIIPAYSSVTVPITGLDEHGDERIGTGLALDPVHILTNAHVIRDMKLHDTITRPTTTPPVLYGLSGALDLRIVDKKAHDDVDVGVITVEPTIGVRGLDPLHGISFRDPVWADDAYVFGYPPVPTSVDADLTVQKGEVVNPAIKSWDDSEYFLYSAITRPGNSGGPIVAQDGRVVGIVAHEVLDTGRSAEPFFRGIPARTVVAALDSFGIGELAKLEDWT